MKVAHAISDKVVSYVCHYQANVWQTQLSYMKPLQNLCYVCWSHITSNHRIYLNNYWQLLNVLMYIGIKLFRGSSQSRSLYIKGSSANLALFSQVLKFRQTHYKAFFYQSMVSHLPSQQRKDTLAVYHLHWCSCRFSKMTFTGVRPWSSMWGHWMQGSCCVNRNLLSIVSQCGWMVTKQGMISAEAWLYIN